MMEIQLPLNANLQLALNKTGGDGLNLKIGQLLEAKVVETQTLLQALTLKVADKTLVVQLDKPLPVDNGQLLQLKVIKLLPVAEFKLISTVPAESTAKPALLANEAWTLKLLPPPPPAQGSNAINPTQFLSSLATGAQLTASVLGNIDNKITLQLFPNSIDTANTQTLTNPAPASLLVTVDSKQLKMTAALPQLQNTQQSATALTADTQILLQVIKPGTHPTFNVLTITPQIEDKIQTTLKQLLPIQASPVELLNHLQQTLPQLQTDASVAETLKNLAQLILQHTPAKAQLTESNQLKQAVDQSGLFLESKLAELLSGKPGLALQDDFKLKIHKLIQLLNQELAPQAANKSAESSELLQESLQKAQSTLAKLTLDQLQSLPREDSPKQSWTLELPFFHNQKNQSVKIEIEQNKANSSEQQQKNWAVSITITPPDLATIHCKISCYDGSVNTRFWSEAADTVEKINAHLDYLKAQFEEKGLTSGFMQAHQGLPAQTDRMIPASMPSLLNEKA